MKLTVVSPRFIEKIYPITIALITAIMCYVCKFNVLINKDFSITLNSTISVSAVMVGFMATMVAVLVSTVNTVTLQRIQDNNAMGLLHSYFHSALITGFMLAIGSIATSMLLGTSGLKGERITTIWVFIAVYFVFATARVISIMLAILRSISNESTNRNESQSSTIQSDPERAFNGSC
jgi:hypothetical protein